MEKSTSHLALALSGGGHRATLFAMGALLALAPISTRMCIAPLLAHEEYQGAQLIITGASFIGLDDAHRQQLTNVYVA